jgi:hypothetical protein
MEIFRPISGASIDAAESLLRYKDYYQFVDEIYGTDMRMHHPILFEYINNWQNSKRLSFDYKRGSALAYYIFLDWRYNPHAKRLNITKQDIEMLEANKQSFKGSSIGFAADLLQYNDDLSNLVKRFFRTDLKNKESSDCVEGIGDVSLVAISKIDADYIVSETPWKQSGMKSGMVQSIIEKLSGTKKF